MLAVPVSPVLCDVLKGNLGRGRGKQLRLLELLRNTNSSVFETLWYPEGLKTFTLYLPDIWESTDLMLLPSETWWKTDRSSGTTGHLRHTDQQEGGRKAIRSNWFWVNSVSSFISATIIFGFSSLSLSTALQLCFAPCCLLFIFWGCFSQIISRSAQREYYEKRLIWNP